MTLRCSPGCLAIVIHDTERCAANIGRLVRVRGPVAMNSELGLPCWLIRPIDPAPYAVEYADGLRVHCVTWKCETEHPDAWLLPLSAKRLPGDATKRSSVAPPVAQSPGQPVWQKEAEIVELLVQQMDKQDRPASPTLAAKQRRLLHILASLEGAPQQADTSNLQPYRRATPEETQEGLRGGLVMPAQKPPPGWKPKSQQPKPSSENRAPPPQKK